MATATKDLTRTEKDSLGPKEIPAGVYYGIQTARAVENFPISGMRAHPTLVRAFGMVKQAAAEANLELGLIDEKRARAIVQAGRSLGREDGRPADAVRLTVPARLADSIDLTGAACLCRATPRSRVAQALAR